MLDNMTGCFEILWGMVALLLLLYYYSTSTFGFWERSGVPGPRPIPFFGNAKDILFAKIPVAVYVRNLYEKYKNKPLVGIYYGREPLIIVNDPELVKDVLIRDFSKFADRGNPVTERIEPLSAHLFNLEPERWRPLRMRLTSVFTAGKIKDMIKLIVDCSFQFEKYLEQQIAKEGPVECRELTARFTTDVIGSCGFGVEASAMSDEESEFRRMGREFFQVNLENTIRVKMKLFVPGLYDLFGFILPDKKYTPFFTKVVADTIKYRTENNIVRPDFIDALMHIKNHPEKLENIKLTDTLLAAQAFVFFAAGFETSATTMSHALYELAQNHYAQDKLRKEIKQYCGKDNASLTFDSINKMEYLDKVFKETLRMYPPGGILTRLPSCDYTFKGTNVTIPKNTPMWIPVLGLQRDSEVFPKPEIFDPERFSEEAVAARHPMYFLPFGHGPRNCIGIRFALYQTKIGLITILRHHVVDVCEKTMIPYEFDPAGFITGPRGNIYLKLTKVED